MSRGFKNALCLAMRPEAWVHRYEHLCKRRANHVGPHRAVYFDAVITWTGDKETRVERREKANA